MKKMISLILAFAMILSLGVPAMAAEDTRTIYFENTENWSTVNAYYWGEGGIGNTWPGTAMTNVEGSIWSIKVPTDAVYIIFNNNVSAQAPDLTIPTDGKNLYTYNSGWSTYGSTGGITGGTCSDVTANYTPAAPVIKITDIVLSEYEGNDSVTVDAENKTYIITIPEDADEISATVTVSGQNLDKASEDYQVKIFKGFDLPFEPGYAVYDSNTGNVYFYINVVKTRVGSALQYSTDGGQTWTDTGWSTVVRKEYNVTVNAAENGSVTANLTAAAVGETVELFVTADEGYELDTLTVADADGNDVTVNEDHTFTMPASAVTVTATFKAAEQVYNITINESENGTVVAMVGEQQATSANHNDDVTLVVTPAEGYRLSSLTVKDASDKDVTVTDSNTFVMPESNVTVTAVFEALTAEITGMSIIIDGVEYNSANTSETNPAVITPATQSLIVKVTGENLQYNKTAIASYAPTVNADTVHADYDWIISQEGDTATRDASHLLEVLSKTIPAWELQYANDGSTLQSSGVYVAYQVPTYAVNISTAVANGTVTVTPNPAEEGETVTVTVEAVAGYAYVVNSLKVINDTTGEEVTVDEAAKTFVMPASTVTVSAEFEKLTVTSASISWGSMSFTYTDGENGAEGAWSNDGTEGAGTVTVKNTGDTTFTAQPVYTAVADYDEIVAKFYHSEDPESPTTMGYALDSDETVTFILKLFNKPEKAIPAGTKIGTVTIRITEGTPE